MLVDTSRAFVATFGLIVVFGGIGVIVTLIVGYIMLQVRGERRQNKEYVSSRGDNAA